MAGGIASAAVPLDDLPEWLLDPPKGRSQVVVPRGVRLILPERKTIHHPGEMVRHVTETDRLIIRGTKSSGGIDLVENKLVRYERRGDREVRYENVDGAWRRSER